MILDTKSYTADLKEITSTTPQQQDEKSHLAKYWVHYLVGGLFLAGLGVLIFWEKISGWIKGKEESGESAEEVERTIEPDKDEDDKE